MTAPPRLSVIIPTHDRARLLERTVDALFAGARDELPPWELIVVDDGSKDDTPATLRRLATRYGERLRHLVQPNLKVAVARNRGMAVARGGLFVFLGDDIIPDPSFLRVHWRRYVADGEPARYAAIGRTFFHPEIGETPFRTYINEWGLQFGFSMIEDPENVPFNFFYTSNLAFSRDLYDEFGGFNESFKEAAWEDIELGYRYEKQGKMRLRHLRDAVGRHHHMLNVRAFCRRQMAAGRAAVTFARLHPELAGFVGAEGRPPASPRYLPAAALAARVLDFLDDPLRIDCQQWAKPLLDYYYRLGVAGH